MKRIAVFASGTGSNALRMMETFASHTNITVALIVSNKRNAGVLHKAAQWNVPTAIIGRKDLYESGEVLDLMQAHRIDWIVLAGFMWLVPPALVAAYPERIVNIHPALLPRYGGKGMYGMHVHEAVHAAGESTTGITIHYVNERYDEGNIIFQAECPISPNDTPQDIAHKVQHLEHIHYPRVVAELVAARTRH